MKITNEVKDFTELFDTLSLFKVRLEKTLFILAQLANSVKEMDSEAAKVLIETTLGSKFYATNKEELQILMKSYSDNYEDVKKAFDQITDKMLLVEKLVEDFGGEAQYLASPEKWELLID